MVSLPGKLSKIEVILQNLAVEAVLFWSYFLRKSDIFFQKSVKNGKNGKKIFKKSLILPIVYMLSCMF